jgi:hypothetical protein
VLLTFRRKRAEVRIVGLNEASETIVDKLAWRPPWPSSWSVARFMQPVSIMPLMKPAPHRVGTSGLEKPFPRAETVAKRPQAGCRPVRTMFTISPI